MSSTSTYYPTYPPGDSSDEEKGPSSLLSSLPKITLSWSDLSFKVPKRERPILQNISGSVTSGELLAVMGPSGAGKSSFLDVICKRAASPTGEILLNGSANYSTREMFSFVEQDDALIGVLTVRESVAFAARLSLPPNTPDVDSHIDQTLRSLGLQDVATNHIGTPLSRGISGGQKRRVTIACSVVARPRVLVLDEPTSGLDAASSREVVSSLKRLAAETNTIVIATIHQPAWETFALFDNLLLLAQGQIMYNGPTLTIDDYLQALGHPTPRHGNPADHIISLVNTEFYAPTSEAPTAEARLQQLGAFWEGHSKNLERGQRPSEELVVREGEERKTALQAFSEGVRKTLILSDRNLKNYSRNLLAFGIRFGMYVGMGLLLALVWIRLGTSSNKINDRLSVHFFSVAFLGFMSVSGIPAFLEERSVFVRERANGLYGPGAYLLANTLTSIPFLFVCTLAYTLICYWAIGLHPGASHYFKFLIYLFLGVFAAESQSLLLASIVPIFVAALALAAFANGLWMVVQGYFIKAASLPKFWYYTFHFIDFQTFSFEILVKNDLLGLIFPCPTINGTCSCPMPSSLAPQQCALAGSDILDNLGYSGISEGLYVGILLIIILVMRLAMWGVLAWRKH
ncbi:P-loop containing nucleoside triphosphate hydrolase protein [Leucosporidium creatinivorum]|uniref:p-loop containing nucleoside triphosphate hydrolase protein n=1 Tax=Leucosporidium creatinivorum TaxID=106004 RepID=A0A1Y2F744_9BASI|nr:P-loop containing nucleoside triphosphate hydrolase protein [Leucosporidium creatinivorum]